MAKEDTNRLPESGVVTVALKMPRGLILQVYRMEDYNEQIMGGGSAKIKKARPTGQKVRLNGNIVPFGVVPQHRIVFGYALTPNVDAQFFKAWWDQNQDSDLVINNLIFAADSEGRTLGWAKDHKSSLSGLEPMQPDKDPRAPRVPKGFEKHIEVKGGVAETEAA